MKAQEVYKLVKAKFPDTEIHTISLEGKFWEFRSTRKTLVFTIDVHGFPKESHGIMRVTGKSWQEAYDNFNSAFAEIAITALNDKYKEQK